jgi:hypothetical protein
MPIDEYSLKVLMSFKIVHGSLYFISPWRGPIFGLEHVVQINY